MTAPRSSPSAVLHKLAVAVAGLKTDLQSESRDRNQQVERVVAKLDEYVAKVQELNVLTNQVLTKTETQLENLDHRIDDQRRDIDAQAARVDAIFPQFAEALDKFAERITAANREVMLEVQAQSRRAEESIQAEAKELGRRVTKLEQWKFWMLGAGAVIGAGATAFASVAKEYIVNWFQHHG